MLDLDLDGDGAGGLRRGARVLRDRTAADADALDRDLRGRRGPWGSARQLVQVYDAGSIPTTPDKFFACHPASLDGAETEGGNASPVVDTTTTLYVDFIGGAPSAGDLAVAYAVGGRWASERMGGTTAICLTQCAGVPVYGATIELWTTGAGSTRVASCTTTTTGCCSFNATGSYVVKVIVSGTTEYSATRTLEPGGTITIALSAGASVVCCGGYAIPYSLTLTDAAGSIGFAYYPDYYYPIWYGGHAVSKTSCSVTTPGGVCVVAPPSNGPVKVCYQMTCVAGSSPVFTVQRSWSWVYQQGTLTPIWYQDASGFPDGQPCATAPPAVCGSPHTDTASCSANPSSTSPFTLSCAPSPAAGNYTSDPVGGSVAISA